MQIDQRTKRLDQIVCEIEGVLLAGVEQTKGWMQAVRDQAAGDSAAQHRVTVVERGIYPALLIAPERGPEQLCKVEGRSLPFQVFGVAGAHAAGV